MCDSEYHRLYAQVADQSKKVRMGKTRKIAGLYNGMALLQGRPVSQLGYTQATLI